MRTEFTLIYITNFISRIKENGTAVVKQLCYRIVLSLSDYGDPGLFYGHPTNF